MNMPNFPPTTIKESLYLSTLVSPCGALLASKASHATTNLWRPMDLLAPIYSNTSKREEEILMELERQWNELQLVGLESSSSTSVNDALSAPASVISSSDAVEGLGLLIPGALGSVHVDFIKDGDLAFCPSLCHGSPSESLLASEGISDGLAISSPMFLLQDGSDMAQRLAAILSDSNQEASEPSNPCDVYKCPVSSCTKTFTRPYNLKSHLVAHSSDRTFSCRVCCRLFLRKHDMLRHEKVHGGTKIRCSECGKHFARPDGLKRHLRSSTRDTSCAKIRSLRAALGMGRASRG
ncbi:hypothetical protein HDU67_002848 [Dinochytrium kinnereticum]|nr:hypothetical protein HDU67_002848 [Dinochytrium kinnereticum]